MSITGPGLSAAIRAELIAAGDVVNDQSFIDYSEALGKAIVDYLVANTVVTTTSGAPDGEHTGNIS